eukprot:m.107542 g.107542  ORF g.107542 m.107542 type:complete len:170 (+) comp8984_c0_seq2:1480-1989(+)
MTLISWLSKFPRPRPRLDSHSQMREYGGTPADAALLHNRAACARACDVVLLVYDAADAGSFDAAVDLCAGADRYLNLVVVASKTDQPQHPQDALEGPDAFCARRGLPPPVDGARRADVLRACCDLALRPKTAEPSSRMEVGTAVMYMGLLAAVVGLSLYAYQKVSRPKS